MRFDLILDELISLCILKLVYNPKLNKNLDETDDSNLLVWNSNKETLIQPKVAKKLLGLQKNDFHLNRRNFELVICKYFSIKDCFLIKFLICPKL